MQWKLDEMARREKRSNRRSWVRENMDRGKMVAMGGGERKVGG